MRGLTLILAAASLLAAATLAGCKLGPDFKAPQTAVPEHFSVPASGAGPQISTAAPAARFWWQEFKDPELDRLEESAAGGNLDLKAAYFRIVEARARQQAARAGELPSLNASASYTREQLGLAGILKSQHVEVPSADSGLVGAIESPINLYSLGFDASWELDLFGKVRRGVEAADAQSVAAEEARRDLAVSLQAEVAQTYLQLRAAQVLARVAREQIQAQRDVAALTESRRQHGLAGEAEVESARGQLRALEAELPPYEQQADSARHGLAVLMGAAPEALDGQLVQQGELPPLPQSIPVGLPSGLVRRRPDVRRAEAQLHAATAEIGVSIAAMFPDISLTGAYGLRNSSTGYLFDWASRFYSFGPTISIPIFHGGALVANVKLSRAQAEEAALGYRQTVLTALQEVEDDLASLHHDSERTAALQDSVAADQRALEIDLDAYRHGLITYVTVLTAQLQTVQARQTLAQAVAIQTTDVVKIYKALGGGWDIGAGGQR
ncbi:MAG TPA: efflux transporter outer membrane subunit [Steroidobacteraceae bacterium]|jgi:NodT family efflux transporter outer membrane factor (OMF) lipoprotein|nr:efflux transporter outer membrane subunit [Steroidobacteraceae bacterium]